MKPLFFVLGFIVSVQAFATEPYHNSSRIYEKNGHMMGEIYSAEGGRVEVNGAVLELVNGKLYLNKEVVYQGKGLVLAELQVDPNATKLTVNGKSIPLPAPKPSKSK